MANRNGACTMLSPWFLILGWFPRNLRNRLWTSWEHSRCKRAAITSPIIIGVATVMLIIALSVLEHLWSLHWVQDNREWIERTWFYEAQYDETSLYPHNFVETNALKPNIRGFHGEQVILFLSDTRNKTQHADIKMLFNILTNTFLSIDESSPFNRMIAFVWMPAILVGGICWTVFMTCHVPDGLKRSIIVMLILSRSWIPCIIAMFGMLVTRALSIAWWCNDKIVTGVLLIALASFLWPATVYAWYSVIAPCSRIRKVLMLSTIVVLCIWMTIPLADTLLSNL